MSDQPQGYQPVGSWANGGPEISHAQIQCAECGQPSYYAQLPDDHRLM